MYPFAKKRFGQHFLHDKQVASRIVAAAHITSQDSVLEIGPGCGALCSAISAACPGQYIAVERDPSLLHKLSGQWPQMQLICANALDLQWEALGQQSSRGACRNWKIVANLPYNIASPLLWDIASRTRNMTQGIFMVQKEVAQRIVAVPGNKQYGALSVWIQSFVQARLLFTVRPGAFTPAPRVDSAVVCFQQKKEQEQTMHCHPQALRKLLQQCFQKRRKQLGTILKAAWSDELERCFTQQGLLPRMRPEQIAVTDFHALARHLEPFLMLDRT